MAYRNTKEDIVREKDNQLEQIDKLPLTDAVRKLAKKDIMDAFNKKMEEFNESSIHEEVAQPRNENYHHSNIRSQKEIWWKLAFIASTDKWNTIIRWDKECCSVCFGPTVWGLMEIWWKPALIAWTEWGWGRISKFFIIRWNEKYSDDFNYIWSLKEIWWKPAFTPVQKNWKQCLIWWKEKYSDDFDSVLSPCEIWWKPAFIARNNWNAFVVRWNKIYSRSFYEVHNLRDAWWKPAFTAKGFDWKTYNM